MANDPHNPARPAARSASELSSSSTASTSAPQAPSSLAEALAAAAAHAPTVPSRPAPTVAERVADTRKRLDDVLGTARTSIPGWDNLAWVEAFARAAGHVKDALPSTIDPLERRALAACLLRFVPPALLPDAASASTPPSSRAPSPARDLAGALRLPADVAARVDDDFAFADGDAPVVHPSWSAFLTHGDLVDAALRPGRHERLLAPRSLSPGAAPGAAKQGAALLVSVDAVKGDVASLTIHGPAGPTQRRQTSDGRDAGPAELRLDVLKSWLLAAGGGARGLDLRRADDRALLLTFGSTLRARRLDGLLARGATGVGGAADPERRADVVEAVVDAAADAVAFATLDPHAVRICLPDNDWGRQAGRVLDATGLVTDVTPRTPSAGRARRELVWLDAIADGGFLGGALSQVQQARAFARLTVSLLAPLGALPCVSARDGNGVLVTILFEDESGGRARGPFWVDPSSVEVRLNLSQAWAAGAGLALAEPKGGFAHEVAALPAWLGAFLDTIQAG
ncbi:MAG: hypothetical protein FJ137_00180 [Deltaproteobacteria bacterium]|nr:hypothetical protein [Deltaproteobacteria bacterium]